MSSLTDLEVCKQLLRGHVVVFCRDGKSFVDDEHGIKPLMKWVCQGSTFEGYSVADKIVGKAAAMLLVKLGVKAVYGEVASANGVELLRACGIDVTYGNLVLYIENRDKSGCCPMEQAVNNTDDIETGYLLLQETCRKMQSR